MNKTEGCKALARVFNYLAAKDYNNNQIDDDVWAGVTAEDFDLSDEDIEYM